MAFSGLLMLGSTQTNATDQSIDVINNTENPLDVGFTLPEKTIAHIQLKKLELLHEAILNDSAEQIRAAVVAGADVNQLRDGKLPLFWAILLKNANAVEALVQLGAKPDDLCAQYITKMGDIKSLVLIVQQGQIKIPLSAIRNPTCYGTIPPICLDLIRELVNHGYDINEIWPIAINLANCCPKEGEEAIRFLVARGADPNNVFTYWNGDTGNTPLRMAAAHLCNKQVVKLLIDVGADIHQKCRFHGSLLSYVINNDNGRDDHKRKEVTAFLLSLGATL